MLCRPGPTAGRVPRLARGSRFAADKLTRAGASRDPWRVVGPVQAQPATRARGRVVWAGCPCRHTRTGDAAPVPAAGPSEPCPLPAARSGCERRRLCGNRPGRSARPPSTAPAPRKCVPVRSGVRRTGAAEQAPVAFGCGGDDERSGTDTAARRGSTRLSLWVHRRQKDKRVKIRPGRAPQCSEAQAPGQPPSSPSPGPRRATANRPPKPGRPRAPGGGASYASISTRKSPRPLETAPTCAGAPPRLSLPRGSGRCRAFLGSGGASPRRGASRRRPLHVRGWGAADGR
jgi:hypothetical protein